MADDPVRVVTVAGLSALLSTRQAEGEVGKGAAFYFTLPSTDPRRRS